MSKKNYESQNSRQQQIQPVTIKRQLSQYGQIYQKHITIFSRNSQKFKNMLSQLRKNGFEYSEQFSFNFKKTIVKNTINSVKYQIQYGNFRTFLFIAYTLYDFKMVKREQIGRGNYGKILLFTYKQQKIVSKSFQINNNSSSINIILIQIFWAKFASILKIGPKFIQQYGYDLIFLNNTCEYLMEECSQNICNLKKDEKMTQNIIKRMRKILAILHSFNIIHGDIKISHFFWSAKQSKVVILDFGLSRFIREGIGQMTETKYFGTYSYSSPDMKKCYFVESAINVDLYYNDLYAIKRCEKLFKESKQKLISEKNTYKYQQQSQWKFIVQIFRFKFAIFLQDFDEAVQLGSRQESLCQCYRQIVIYQKKNYFEPFIKKNLLSLLKLLKPSNQVLDNTSVTQQFIYTELLKIHQKSIFNRLEVTQNLIETMHKKDNLKQFLQQKGNMEIMFGYIFQQKTLSRTQRHIKYKIIQYVFQTLNSACTKKISKSQITRQVLLFFEKYFYENSNLLKLKKIQKIFILTCEVKYLRRVQQRICQVFLKNLNTWMKDYIVSLKKMQKNTKNVRKSWQRFTTQQCIRNEFLSEKDEEFIKPFTNIIQEINRKKTANFINIEYDENQLQKIVALCPQQIIQYEPQIVLENPSTKLSSLQSNSTQFLQNSLFYLGVDNWQDHNLYQPFKDVLSRIDYIMRQTVWHLAKYHRQKNIIAFENCLSRIFDDVFVTDQYQGLVIFTKFSNIFRSALKYSKKTKQMMLKFLNKIQIKKIIEQIDAYALKQLIQSFLDIVKTFMMRQFDEKKQIVRNLNHNFRCLKQYVSINKDKQWAGPKSDIVILLEVLEIYYATKRSQSWLQTIQKMVQMAENIFYNGLSMKIFGFVVSVLSQPLVQPKFRKYLNSIHQIFMSFTDKQLLYSILSRNIGLFQALIRRLLQNHQFQKCFSLLEQYRKISLSQCLKNVNKTYIDVYYDFCNFLPTKVAAQMFIQKLDTYTLRRIGQNPYLSFIFFFLIQKLITDDDQKIRFLKIICFGLSKISIKYHYGNKKGLSIGSTQTVKASYFLFHRTYIKFKNSRKQRLHYQKQARSLQNQDILNRNAQKKQKKCNKIKSELIKDLLLDKINKYSLKNNNNSQQKTKII